MPGAACSAYIARKTEFGRYRAETTDGRFATLVFDTQGKTAVLGWTGDAGTVSEPATVSWGGSRIVVTLRSGLTIDGRLTGNDRFQLTYPQYSNGAPALGQPSHTLNFALASVS